MSLPIFLYIFLQNGAFGDWLGWGWASSLVWHGELWRVLALQEGCCHSLGMQVAGGCAGLSVIPDHPSSKPTWTPMKAFPPFQVRWHCEDDSYAVPRCPGEGGCCGSKGGYGSCPCCLARALLVLPSPHICLSICLSIC